MARRGNEAGMDFEFDNKTGPMDARSPFASVGHNAQRFPQSNMDWKRMLLQRMYTVGVVLLTIV